MGIHNAYLPDGLHRVCNGLLWFVVSLALGALGYSHSQPGTLIGSVSAWVALLSVPIGIAGALFARRASIAEGVAGEAGYDELADDDVPGRDQTDGSSGQQSPGAVHRDRRP